MSFTNVRSNLRRYRAVNPYSHTLFFFFVDVFLGLFKIALLGVVLVAAWLAGSTWMKNAQHQSPQATAIVKDENKQELGAAPRSLLNIEVEIVDVLPNSTLGTEEGVSSDKGQESLALQSVVVSGQLVLGAPAKTAVPAVVRVYEKSELSRDTAAPMVNALVNDTNPLLAIKPDEGSRVFTALPVYTIKVDQTKLRSQASADSPVLKVLDKGQTITVFDDSGTWVQVATNDGLGSTGYVHNSLLEAAEIK